MGAADSSRVRRRVTLLAAVVVGLVASLLTAGPARAAESDLSVSLAVAPAAAQVGQTATVTVVVVNSGAPVGQVDVSLYTDLPVRSTTAAGGSCTAVLGSPTCSFPGLGDGATASVVAVLELARAGTHPVDAAAGLVGDIEPDLSNNVAVGSVTATPAVPVVSLSASAGQVRFGAAVDLVARVAVGGVPASAPVTLLGTTAGGAQTEVVSSHTDGNGRAVFTEEPGARTEYVVRVDASDDVGGALSAPVVVQVGYAVTTTVSPVAIPPGGRLSLRATVRPAVPGATVTVQERFGAGAWRTVATPALSADGTVTVSLGRRSTVGAYALRVVRPADGARAEGSAQTTTVVTVTGAGKAGAWRPLAGTKSSPSRWGTCTIGYRVNQRHMPPHGMADLREAMRRVTQVNGTRFRYLGRTRLVPYAGDSRAGIDKITVGWAGSAATRGLLGPGIAGVGGTSHLGRRIRTGYLVLNTAYSSRAPEGFGEGMPHGLVLMHELGHVIGLDHTADRHQIMNPGRPLPASVWGAADLKGLRALGRASGCR